jgi:SET domain-containing protein
MLIKKKGEEWVKKHWTELNKARSRLRSRPTLDVKADILSVKRRKLLGDEGGAHIENLEHQVEVVGEKAKEVYNELQDSVEALEEICSDLNKRLQKEREKRRKLKEKLCQFLGEEPSESSCDI